MSIALAPAVSESDAVDRENVPSVTKALQLLEAFRSSGAVVGVSEIARLADVPKSTAFRLLAHLEKSGFVERRGRGTAWASDCSSSATACRCVGRAAFATSRCRT